jgi:hypothetical protein
MEKKEEEIIRAGCRFRKPPQGILLSLLRGGIESYHHHSKQGRKRKNKNYCVNPLSQLRSPARANHKAPRERDGNEVPGDENVKTHWNITNRHISVSLRIKKTYNLRVK